MKKLRQEVAETHGWDLEMTSRDSPSIECSKNTLHGEVELGESKRPTLRLVNDMSCNVGFEENSAHAASTCERRVTLATIA